jgi:hypothetical protein
MDEHVLQLFLFAGLVPEPASQGAEDLQDVGPGQPLWMSMDCSFSCLQIWFQNRRAKERKTLKTLNKTALWSSLGCSFTFCLQVWF